MFTLEATGYALLALTKLGRMEEAAAPFKWLSSQRRRGGGFGSTQVPLSFKYYTKKKEIKTLVVIITLLTHVTNYSLPLYCLPPPQSTMVVLQALSEYLANKPPPPDLTLDVDVKLSGRKDIRYHFNPSTAYAARSSRVRKNLNQVRLQNYSTVWG